MFRLLVATPDRGLRSVLLAEAAGDSLQATGVATIDELRDELSDDAYHLVILDDRLADADLPMLVCDINAPRRGLLVLTSETSELPAVQLLDLGADDVVRRPYSSAELRARVHAILRGRARPARGCGGEAVVGPICLDVGMRSVTVRGVRLHVPRLEFAVLLALHKRNGAPVPRGVLLEECWTPQMARRPEYVDAVMRRLRLRLELDPARPQHLVTIRRKGYALWP